MPDEPVPRKPASPPRNSQHPAPRQPVRPEYSAGHVPITEEFDSAKRTLPPVAPVAIALVVVAIVVGIIAFAFRAKPVAQGGIDAVYVSTQPGQPNIFVPIQVTLRNVTDKTIYVKEISATVKTDQGEQSDTGAASTDYERYFAAFPDLKEHSTQPLVVETKIAPGAEQKGTVLVSFPLTKEQFEARKDLTVTIQPYDQREIVLREKSTAAK
jgi:hypothetical protein